MDSPPTIAAALSGGVDSATAAAMLLEQGHRVVGMTMRLDRPTVGGASASGGAEPPHLDAARDVCAHLGIPFHVVDLGEEFERQVKAYFTQAYLAGETPNPCAKCNQHIKFGALLDRARSLGAEVLATGHYVASIRFPLGGLTKVEVRARAQALGLPNASRAESQEICFLPDGEYAAFVEERARESGLELPAGGEIVDLAGQRLGEHRGTHHYTIGQRRGLGVGGRAAPNGESGSSSPVYVVALDRARARVIVGPKSAAARRELRVHDLRWLADPPADDAVVLVQVRHRARAIPARVAAENGGARVRFEEDAVVAAPGQAAVFYDRDIVLGGGWICPPTNGGSK